MNTTQTRRGLLDTVRMVQAGSAQPQDFINESHARAAALESDLQAFTYLPPQPPTVSAGNGPLAGIAVGAKDLVDTAEMPTTYGSPIYADHQPNEDAWIVSRLKDFSATILGKTVTTEFAWRHPGPTRNPWNRNHTPGGSSSGSAASVASGSVQLALGTQTLGSILRPAAFCGIVGVKPSFGTISLKGVRALSQSLDHLGVFARSVDDVAYALSLLMGGPGAVRHAPFQVSPDGIAPFPAPRIAWLQPAASPALDDYQSGLLATAAERFTEAGAIVESFAMPAEFEALSDIAATLYSAEGAANFSELVARFPDKTSDRLKALVEEGMAISATSYIAARNAQLALRSAFTAAMAGFDAVLTTAATGEAPESLTQTGDPGLCVPWTTLGVPAIALPAGIGPRGLPLGIQLVAPYGENLKLLRVAKWCEAALAFKATI